MRFIRVVSVFVLAALASSGVADPICPCDDVCYTTSGTGGSVTSFTCTEDQEEEGVYDLEIVGVGSTPANEFTINIRTDSGAVLRSVLVKNTGASSTCLRIDIQPVGLGGLSQVVSVEKHGDSTGEVWIESIRNADNGIGDGLIKVDRIELIDVPDDIEADFYVFGSQISGQDVAIQSLVTTNGGRLLGEIYVAEDSVQTIDIDGDIAGTAAIVATDIDSISTGGDLDTSIDAGNLRRVVIGGDLNTNIGAVTMEGDEAGVFIQGDHVAGGIYIAEGLDAETRIEIDGSFGLGTIVATIELPNYGDLRGQVIINKANSGGTWANNAYLCFTEEEGGFNCEDSVTEPYYPQTAELLGGGSIGLAPFRLHATSCYPADGETVHVPSSLLLNGVCFNQCERDEVEMAEPVFTVRHYGPVQWTGGDPLTVKRRDIACEPEETWDNVTSDFDFAAGSNPTEIRVTYVGDMSGFWPLDYEYLIEPVAGVLKCAEVAGNPNVADYDYNFFLVGSCA